MIVSIGLHIIAFIIFAFVKFLPDKEVRGATVGVAFVNVEKTRLLKRSLPVRAVASLSKTSQSRPTAQQVDTRIDHKNSSEFYISNAPERTFSEVKSLKSTVVGGNKIRRPTANFGRDMAEPMAVELRQSNTQTIQMGISGGHELFGKESASGLKKPDVKMIRDAENVMQKFLSSVRKDIESRKKYPVAARDAGIEGRSGVKMVILKNGQLEKVELVDSSGHEILDRAALQSVRDAAPFPPIPEQTERDKIELSIYLVFKIT